MLILAKAAMAMMLGFILSIISGLILIPLLKKKKIGQFVSSLINVRHQKKSGTPTMGGIIFIIPVYITILLLLIRGSIHFSYNLGIVLFVFTAYAALGFVDDYLKVYKKNNKGISTVTKFLVQMFIALVFFYLYLKGGGEATITMSLFNISLEFSYLFGMFILVVLLGTTNAVNITDGLDGLAGSLSLIAFLSYGIIAWNCGWLVGYEEIAIFCFTLVGSLMGFLVFNTHPAKVFMGDLGSLALGGALASIAIITKHEFSLVLIGGVFVIETLSSLIQIIAIRQFKTKIFKKAPIHHHFEEIGWEEGDILRLFLVIGLMLSMLAITYGVWL
ncbi:MAG: phospho-N-acetylmuramoyl-pentapeptide-transferase [bacterium]